MSRNVVVGALCVIVALLVLVVGHFKSSFQYYVTVDELMADLKRYEGREVKLAGAVVDESVIKSRPEKPIYQFQIENEGVTIAVRYEGLAPDTFNDQSTVVVTGRYIKEKGQFEAHHLLAKCASKYEAKLPTGSVDAESLKELGYE